MTSDDPWSRMALPDPTAQLAGRRIDPTLPWDCFWARDRDGRAVFYMSFAADSTPDSAPPKLRGVQVTLRCADQTGVLMLTLLDASAKDLFRALCENIVQGTRSAEGEKEAVAVALARTWRWHHLLRGGPSRLLSREEQKGLIGELEVLRTIMLPRFGAIDAVSSWRGPLDSPKDFELSRSALEVKARRGTATPFIAISSEFQLDTSGCGALLLSVIEVSDASADDTDAVSLTDVVTNTRNVLGASSEAALEPFDGLVAAAGFDGQDDYSDQVWVIGGITTYRVGDGFPKLSDSDLPSALSHVRYSVDLTALDEFRVDDAELHTILTGSDPS